MFLQSSYCNDTNIYTESDVDVVIRLDPIFYYDTSALSPAELAAFDTTLVPGNYAYDSYKAGVVAALKTAFGADAITIDKRALKIRANGARRSADVIVAAQFRHYRSMGLAANSLAGMATPSSSKASASSQPPETALRTIPSSIPPIALRNFREQTAGSNQWCAY